MTDVAAAVQFQAADAVRDAVAGLGRTEDVRRSPSGRRLAIACYGTERIALVDVELEPGSEGPRVELTGIELHQPAGLREPHGIDFVDEDALAVANRGGGVLLLRLPSADSEELTLVEPDDGGGLLDSPGSIAVRPLESGGHEVLTCNDWMTGPVRRLNAVLHKRS